MVFVHMDGMSPLPTQEGGPINLVAPSVSGLPLVGSVLTVDTGQWINSPAFSLQWAWADTGAIIPGANDLSYTPQASDVGHTLKCIVTGVVGARRATVETGATAVVTDIPANALTYGGVPLTYNGQFLTYGA
jgi:hypothetical protein